MTGDPRFAGGLGRGSEGTLTARVAELERLVASLMRDPTGAQIRSANSVANLPATSYTDVLFTWDRPFETTDYTVLASIESSVYFSSLHVLFTGSVFEKFVDSARVFCWNPTPDALPNVPVRAIAIAGIPGEA
jgi:hypothetical protein